MKEAGLFHDPGEVDSKEKTLHSLRSLAGFFVCEGGRIIS